jgi:hypothetical protein
MLLVISAAPPATAQWATAYHQLYGQASHNWEFRRKYPSADRLFNAFDYGHAILYETLLTKPNAPTSRLEQQEYDFITQRLLVRPPRLPLEESAIEVEYAKLVPEAKELFEWAHILHRQVYDVWADDRLSADRKDREVRRLLEHYLSRRAQPTMVIDGNMAAIVITNDEARRQRLRDALSSLEKPSDR